MSGDEKVVELKRVQDMCVQPENGNAAIAKLKLSPLLPGIPVDLRLVKEKIKNQPMDFWELNKASFQAAKHQLVRGAAGCLTFCVFMLSFFEYADLPIVLTVTGVTTLGVEGAIWFMKRRDLQDLLPPQDDRLAELRAIILQVEEWDRTIVEINRLIDQIELGLVPYEERFVSMLRELKEEEKRVAALISYADRLLKEGELGEMRHGTSPDLVAEGIVRRKEEAQKRKEAFQAFTHKVSAAREVDRQR